MDREWPGSRDSDLVELDEESPPPESRREARRDREAARPEREDAHSGRSRVGGVGKGDEDASRPRERQRADGGARDREQGRPRAERVRKSGADVGEGQHPRRPETPRTAPRSPHADDEPASEKPRRETPARSEGRTISQAFADLGLSGELLDALADLNFETPTDIQRELLPPALEGKDCLGQAKTGTGKTAAFGLPMLQRLEPGGGIQGLVLVPTRELAKQVHEHFRQLGSHSPHQLALAYGGAQMNRQMDALRRKPEIVVGTPGRVLDFMRRGALPTRDIRIVVLDEVDRMLDIGFRDDIRRILRDMPQGHQTIFVSATLDDEIRKLARTFMRDPVEVNVSRDALTVENIEQGFVTVDVHDKFATLLGFIKHEAPSLMIVFTRTKHSARRVARRLAEADVRCKELHGDLIQSRRERAMESFRKAHIQVLVATDIASRGIDVLEVSHIINYDLPEDPAVYVHRVGRTARMGRAGCAISFVTREEGKNLTAIEMHINKMLPQIEADWLARSAPPGPIGYGRHSGHGGQGPDRGAQPAPGVSGRVPSEGDGEREAAAGAESTDEFETPPAEPVGADAASEGRYTESLRRDEKFESLGLRPVRRTLGSRFRSARRLRR